MKKSGLAVIGGIVAAIVVGLWLTQVPSFDTEQAEVSNPPIEQNEPAASKLKVIASFYPLYEFSKNVGGDKAKVSSLIPIGVEPHDWEPSSGDVLDLKEADLFIYNGGGFEPFVKQLIDSGEYGNVVFVESTKGVDLLKSQHNEDAEEEHDEHDSEYDPHIWLDPILAKYQVTTIKNAMIQADPQNVQYYETNADAYNEKLDELDTKIKTELSSCNKDTFMPFHDAFTYFANRYDLKIFALSGISPDSEATADEIKEFIDFVKENEITVIFAEELIDPRLAEVLADEAGVQVMILSPLEGLTEEEIKAGKNYITKMEENLANLKVALDCQ
jgi:zinc transport system substrate-binding protein